MIRSQPGRAGGDPGYANGDCRGTETCRNPVRGEGGEAVGAKADERMEIREVTGHEGLVCTPRSQRRERVRGRGVWLQTRICGIRYLSGHAFTQ